MAGIPDDFKLALQLQSEYDQEARTNENGASDNNGFLEDDHALALKLQREFQTEHDKVTMEDTEAMTDDLRLLEQDHTLAMKLQKELQSENDNYGMQEQEDDHTLALKLVQRQFDDTDRLDFEQSNFTDVDNSRRVKNEGTLSLVDPQWELIDPNPDVRMLFLQYNDKFFWGRLSGVEVRWSPRMTLCAGLCVYEGHGGLCSVRLSTPLLKLRPRKDLVETLLHEMIHAYLFVTDNDKDHDGHGPEFHKHMDRINSTAGTNITVYHSFHDEVESYKQHWWYCDGPCRTRPPYFGYVKRAMNRAPSARDFWWKSHVESCGGTYTKVKEPEGYGQKKQKKSPDNKGAEGNVDIRTMFQPQTNPKLTGKTHKSPSSTVTSNADKLNNAVDNISHHPNQFNAKGKVLTDVGTVQNYDVHSIVRKIPGIGVIESGRKGKVNCEQITVTQQLHDEKTTQQQLHDEKTTQQQLHDEKTTQQQPQDEKTNSNFSEIDSDDSECVIFSPVSKENPDLSNKGVSTKTTQNKKTSPEESQSKLDKWLNTSDETQTRAKDILDSEDELEELLKEFQKRRKSKNDCENDNAKFMGNKQFRSVSASVSSSGNKPSASVSNVNSNDHVDNFQSRDEVFVSGRNKRAHDLGMSSESSDDEFSVFEKQSISSVIAGKKMKLPTPKSTNATNENKVQHEHVLVKAKGDDTVCCPVCGTNVSSQTINIHLDGCLS